MERHESLLQIPCHQCIKLFLYRLYCLMDTFLKFHKKKLDFFSWIIILVM